MCEIALFRINNEVDAADEINIMRHNTIKQPQRTLPQEASEAIEVRLCGDEGISNEDTYIELLEVYIQ